MPNICPWYRQGFCTSPALDKPTDSVTSPRRCFSDYKICNLYRESGKEREGLENFAEESKLHITELMPSKVYANETVPESSCEHFVVSTYDGKYYTYCKKRECWLTRSQARLCVTYYQRCPWRVD